MASLEELKKRLYKEKETFGERMVPPELARPQRLKTAFWRETARELPKSKWFLWVVAAGATLFFLGIIFFIFGSPAIFRAQNIELKIEGLKEIKSGDRISWQVKVSNKNNKTIESALLVFNFPDGATPLSGEKPAGVFRERRTIGQIGPGESVAENFDAYVFGGRGAEKKVSAVLEYRPAGGSAVFAIDTSFLFSVASAPVAVSFKLPPDLRIGQTIDVEINYGSQSEAVVSNLSLQVSLPDDFELSSATPGMLPQYKNIWRVGDLKPSETGLIKIKGILRGADLESKIFTAALGVFDAEKNSFLAYDEISQPVTLHSPFLAVEIMINGAPSYTSFPGDELSFELKLKNNLSVEAKNVSLEAKIESVGDALDLKSLKVEKGFYSESSRSIIWNASTHEAFKVLAAGAENRAVFSVKTKNNLPLLSENKRPLIKLNVFFKPGGEIQGFEGADVSGANSVEIKISSKLQMASRAFYANSAITNSGPLPPKVGQETTYTVAWSLANMVNDTADVAVKSFLPPYISFKNVIVPTDANFSFDNARGEVVWRVGRLAAGTGFLRPAAQVAFQIGLVPSENQIDTMPFLINTTEAAGRDIFTGQILNAAAGAISTELQDDPNIGFNQKRVVP